MAEDKSTGEDATENKAAVVIVVGRKCHVEGLDATLRILTSYRYISNEADTFQKKSLQGF